MALVKWWNHIKKLKGKVKTRNDILDLELIIIKEHKAKCKGRGRSIGRNKGRHGCRRSFKMEAYKKKERPFGLAK